MRDWVDGHVHALGGGAEALKELAEREADFGYTHANFLSVEGMDDAAQNALAIGFKLLSDRHYAFGGLPDRGDIDPKAEMLRLWNLGLDGMKMIENKPTERKRLGLSQDDPRLDPMYAAAEEAGIPFLVHVNDPRDFWSDTDCPDWAKSAGYFYGDGSYVPFEQILSETVHMLEKHPKLRICFAHFLFLSDDRASLSEILDRFPNVCLDVTAGTEMYYNFSSDPDAWRAFFCRYQDRILYGTDNSTPFAGEDIRIADVLNTLERRFFLENGPVPLWDGEVNGLGLPEDVFRKLRADNFFRFTGKQPRPVDRKKAADYLKDRLTAPDGRLDDRERAITERIIEECLHKA